jgi:peptidyl-prolyl cis-trans isomerase D
MAILNKIREKTVVLILVIALALFAFILSGLFSNGDLLLGKSQNVVATINDEDITRDQFMAQVEQQQQRMGPQATSSQVMNSVFEAFVREAVMSTQFEKLGLSVESDQMRELLKTNLANSPEFQNEAGLFDNAKLTEYIANIKETSKEQYAQWVAYEQSVASSGLQNNYFAMVKAATTATLQEGELEHKLENDMVDVSYVTVPYSSIADDKVKVTDEEIKSYISKNEKQFKVKASSDIQYVMFEEKASEEDKEEIKTKLAALENDKEVFENNKTINKKGLKNTENIEEFVNANSDDFKYFDTFQTKEALPQVAADTLTKLNVGDVYGPYLDGEYFKLSKLVATTKLPDSVKARHILIPFIGAQSAQQDVTRTEEQAKAFADSLVTVLKADKSKFPQFVKDYSTDSGSLEKEGRYDWYAYNAMVPEFRDFTFEKNVGDLDAVKTAFGFHIIEVEGQKGESTLYKVATIARQIEPSDDTVDKVFRDASTFEVSLENKSFDEVAKASNYELRPVKSLKVLDDNIAGIGSQRDIVRWSHNEDTKVGDYKRFAVNGGYAVVQLTQKNKEGLMSVENARPTVAPKLLKDKKAKMIMDGVNASTLEAFASAKGQQVKTANGINMKNPTIAGAGREPLVVGYAFGLKNGGTSKLIQGESGVFMVKRNNFTPAVKLDNYQAAANQVGAQKLSTVQTKLYTALKDAAEIEDYRATTVQ